MFQIIIEKQALKYVRRLPVFEQERILNEINQRLKENPFPHGGNPKQLKSSDKFRLRVGNYRVIYEIHEKTVIIFKIKHRKEVYRNL